MSICHLLEQRKWFKTMMKNFRNPINFTNSWSKNDHAEYSHIYTLTKRFDKKIRGQHEFFRTTFWGSRKWEIVTLWFMTTPQLKFFRSSSLSLMVFHLFQWFDKDKNQVGYLNTWKWRVKFGFWYKGILICFLLNKNFLIGHWYEFTSKIDIYKTKTVFESF